MTNTEKFILTDPAAADALMNILACFRGKDYKFAKTTLNAAAQLVGDNSHFDFEHTARLIKDISKQVK